MTYAIEASGLVKRFGDTLALDGIDLAAREGSVLGVLGPNGAGKTTAVRILATLLRPDGGSARVAGLDVVRDAHAVRQQIGLTGQYASVDEDLTGLQNLVLIGQLLDLSGRSATARAKELLAWFDLSDGGRPRWPRPTPAACGGASTSPPRWSVGQPVIFLDEPTTGLDPAKREDMWDVVRDLVTDGSTVLLTTQYLEEADALADEITVIDHGQVIAHDTPDGLKRIVGGQTLTVRPADSARLDVRGPRRSSAPCRAPNPSIPGRGTLSACRSPATTAMHRRAWPAWARAGIAVTELSLHLPEPRRGLLHPHRRPARRPAEDAA